MPPKPKKLASKKPTAKAFRPTGQSVGALRKNLQMTPQEFADHRGVSKASVVKWEAPKSRLKLSVRSFQCLEKAYNRTIS